IEMYRAVGHFDFQISAMLGNRPAVWPVQPGKEIGTMADRLMAYIPNLSYTNSPAFMLLFAISTIFGLFLAFKKKIFVKYGDGMRLFLVSFAWVALLMLLIGPQFRFLTLLTPFLCLSVGPFICSRFDFVREKKYLKIVAIFIFVAIIVFEIFYSWNSEIALYPKGEMNTFWSKLRFENYNWGYNELGAYMEKELAGRAPALSFDLRHDFLGKIRDEAVTRAIDSGAEPYSVFFVWDGNFDEAGKLWTLDRLHIFHGWPIISMPQYLEMLKINGEDFFKISGFKKSYLILMNNKVPDDNDRALSDNAEKIIIRNPKGDEVFYLYIRSI
ncbi:MAG: hypothetical protein AAB965_02825, partial [Patescibacteria group bacterium]